MQNLQPRARSRAARTLMSTAGLVLLFTVATGQASTDGCEPEPAPAPSPQPVAPAEQGNQGASDPQPGQPTPPVSPPASVAAKPGHVRGIVTDSRGRPMRGVEMLIRSSTTGGYGSTVNAVTDANGMYEVQVPDAQWSVDAWTRVTYGGSIYMLGLDPAEGDWRTGDSRSGVVRNFVWKISGEVPRATDLRDRRAYYGGAVSLSGWLIGVDPSYPDREPNFPPGSRVEVTLTPSGALIDGSQGRTLKFTRTYEGGFSYSRGERGEQDFLDIPIGTYTVTATVTEPGGASYPGRVAVQPFGEVRASGFAPSQVATIPPTRLPISPYRRSQVDYFTVYVLR